MRIVENPHIQLRVEIGERAMQMNKSLVTRFVLFAMLSFTVAVMGCSSDDGGPAGSGGTGGDGGMGGGGTGGGMGGTGGGMGGTGGTPIGAVTATPSGMSFIDSIEVTLTTDVPDGTICYSTDLSPVVNEDGDAFLGGTEYTGPITLTDTAVLKFTAVVGDCDAGGTGGAGGSGVESFSPEQREGYVDATGNPIRAEWAKSGHGDIAAEPWRHWDWDDPQEVSSRCSRCHAPQASDAPMDVSYLAYASTGAQVAAPVALGIDCVNCHQTFPTIYSNLAKFGLPDGQLEPTTFPSSAELSLFSSSNVCLICHQGRDSGVSVQEDIDADDGAGPYSLPSIHYYAAAATLFGSEGNAGYQYPSEEYKPRNVFGSHPDEFSNCVGCHMKNAEGGEMHTWIPSLASCQSCHGGDSFETLGGTPGQSYTNIQTLLTELTAAIQTYAADVIGLPIVYDDGNWCYDNGEPCTRGNRYDDFDATLLPAAYNHYVVVHDPNGHIHNGIYFQQLMYDSIVALGGSPSVMVAGRGNLTLNGSGVGGASKTQQWAISGHAAAAGEPFRHWDEDYEADGYTPTGISASCTRCHSTPGFGQLVEGDVPTSTMPTTTVDCWSCHNDFNLFSNPETRYDDLTANPELASVEFPSGDSVSLGNASNICMTCHQGRSSKVQVDNATDNGVTQTPTNYPSYDFINIHYYAAGATFFGTDVQGGYEYDGNTYRGQNTFVGLHTSDGRTLVDCIGCHLNASEDPDSKQRHTFLPQVADCNQCHSGQEFQDLSGSPSDNYREINILVEDLYAAIQDYATNDLSSPVFYDSSAYPYWFKDNDLGANFGNRYRDFDFNMLTAAYNYQVALKDPGGYIHNGGYIEQLLFDSTCLMGGTPRVVTVPGRPGTCP